MSRGKNHQRWSKRMSYVLRHDPASAGVELDDAGWVSIDALLDGLGGGLDRNTLAAIVATSPKQRFAISADGARIRANQGHSIPIELGYEPTEPPERLYHGTHPGAVDEIRATGIRRMSRHHVHLSVDAETATSVGSRRGKPVILAVRAGDMHRAGHAFYVSANGVWLTDEVPPQYIE
jgi:putative RNA 2'-phosphotransferase